MRIAFCFDLDGTLTQEEILPQIAKHVDLFEEIDLLTKITMRGLITFSKSFKLRVRLLSTVPITTVKQTVNAIPVDKALQAFVQNNKADCYIVTGNLDVWVDEFIDREYGCAYFSSLAKVDGDKLLDIAKILDKQEAILELRSRYDVIVAVGDGMNDCTMLEHADVGIAFGGVHEPVSTLVSIADYVCYDGRSLAVLLESLKQKHVAEN